MILLFANKFIVLSAKWPFDSILPGHSEWNEWIESQSEKWNCIILQIKFYYHFTQSIYFLHWQNNAIMWLLCCCGVSVFRFERNNQNLRLWISIVCGMCWCSLSFVGQLSVVSLCCHRRMWGGQEVHSPECLGVK